MPSAQGTFEVHLEPQYANGAREAAIDRMLISKRFHGDLEGTSSGQMLSAGTGQPGSSGAYVALERVEGTLHGRRGSFVLHHRGLMTRGEPQLTIAVVPDSATSELSGLSGSMEISIVDGAHSYIFTYTLAEPG